MKKDKQKPFKPLLDQFKLPNKTRRMVVNEFIGELIKLFKHNPSGFSMPLSVVYAYIKPELLKKWLERNAIRRAGIVMKIKGNEAGFTLRDINKRIKEEVEKLRVREVFVNEDDGDM